ncbi:MAG: hypothetical protein R3B06_05705 [Kofleriaceae bacterium]
MSASSSRSRRAFLRGIGQSAALLVGGAALAQSADAGPALADAGPALADAGDGTTPAGPPAPRTTARHDDLPTPPGPVEAGYLGPVAVGTTVGAWRVARVHGVFRGALPFVLAHADGRRAQVDLMAHDAASPPGIAAASAGHLYLVNSGGGTRATPPDLEHAIRQLAQRLDGRPGQALGLLSKAERGRRHPGAVYVVPA